MELSFLPALPTGARSRTAALIIVLGTGLGACAQVGRPPGGPEDKEPPLVLAAYPGSLAVDVDPATELRLVFNEKIDARSVEKALWVSPPRVTRDIRVSGSELRVRFRRPFPDSSTVNVLLSTALLDARRNPLVEPYRWMFSTGPTIDPGRVTGRVERVGPAGRGQVLVALYPILGDTLPDPLVEEPVAITEATTDGEFTLSGLRVDGAIRLLYALFDRDQNRVIAGRGEYVTAAPESVRLTAAAPELEVALRLVDPEGPGDLQGILARAVGDTVGVGIELHVPGQDTLGTAKVAVLSGPDGRFELKKVEKGSYRIIAFCDLNANGSRDREEPWVVSRDSIAVQAGEVLDLGELPGPDCTP